MKKVVSILAVLLCAALLTVTAGAAATDAFALYEKASKKMEAANSVEMRGTMKMTMEASGDVFAGETIEMNCPITIKQVYTKDGKLQMETRSTMEFLGEEQVITSYYKDGYMYQNTDGVKTKVKMDAADAKDTAYNLDYDLTKDMFQNATVEKVDGGQRVKFKLAASEVGQIFDPMMGEIMDGASADGMKISMGGINYSMTIGDNNQLKSYNMAFKMNLYDSEYTIKVKYTVGLKVISLNQLQSINFPSDLSSYR